MKITGSGPTVAAGQRRKVSGRSGERTDASFAEQLGTRLAAGSGIPPTTPLVALDGALAVPEVPDPTRERRQATRRGHGLLDELHQLQIGMVEGWVSEGALRRLAGLLDRRPTLTDPDLDAVLDEIELRAAVELAKLTRGPV
ncbi:MAG TPA: flagellar assembly protein FliX [Geminicoccaceae bacterium]|nr:flagellar assembly protein FliX [Geminicoccaceae bacterium]